MQDILQPSLDDQVTLQWVYRVIDYRNLREYLNKIYFFNITDFEVRSLFCFLILYSYIDLFTYSVTGGRYYRTQYYLLLLYYKHRLKHYIKI